MLLGVVSDVHCNVDALDRAIAAMGDIDELLVAGDLVYEYRFSNEVVDTVRRVGARCIKGNHDMVLLSHHGERAQGGGGCPPGAGRAPRRAARAGGGQLRSHPPADGPRQPVAALRRLSRSVEPGPAPGRRASTSRSSSSGTRMSRWSSGSATRWSSTPARCPSPPGRPRPDLRGDRHRCTVGPGRGGAVAGVPAGSGLQSPGAGRRYIAQTRRPMLPSVSARRRGQTW